MRQRDVAAAAGISLSLYKRLEAGRAHNVRYHTLVRVASALGLRPSEQARLLALARPDLARLTQARGFGAPSPDLLRVLRATSLTMARSRNAEELYHVARRSLTSLLGDDATLYLLHPERDSRLEVTLRFGSATGGDPSGSGMAIPVPTAMRHGQTVRIRISGGTRSGNAPSPVTSLTLVPVRVRGELVAALAIGGSIASDRPARVAVVETVAALLEAALANLGRRR